MRKILNSTLTPTLYQSYIRDEVFYDFFYYNLANQSSLKNEIRFLFYCKEDKKIC